MAARRQLVAKVEGGALVPAAWADRQAVAEVEDGTLFTLTKYRPRSDAQNRYLHALLGKAADNAPEPWTIEKLKGHIKLRNGWFEGARVEVDGSVFTSLRSTADFTLEEMRLFCEQAEDFILTEVCPGMDLTLLRKEAEAEIAPARQVRS